MSKGQKSSFPNLGVGHSRKVDIIRNCVQNTVLVWVLRGLSNYLLLCWWVERADDKLSGTSSRPFTFVFLDLEVSDYDDTYNKGIELKGSKF